MYLHSFDFPPEQSDFEDKCKLSQKSIVENDREFGSMREMGLKQIKEEFPDIKLHTLGPPEIAHISKLSGKSHKEVLETLKAAGMDSLPGAGAEILVDRVRKLVSNGKCGADEFPRGG